MRVGKLGWSLTIAGSLAVMAALAWYANYQWNHRYDVPVGVPTSLNKYDDEIPVATTLHEYANWGSSDETTGRSISFSFPRSYYAFSSNARGGPQRYVAISIDRLTMDRVDTQREIAIGNLNTIPTNAYVLESLGVRNFDISIYSNKSNRYQGNYRAIHEALSKGTTAPFAAFCGITWYLHRQVKPWLTEPNGIVPSNKEGPGFGLGAALSAALDGEYVDGEPATAYCNAGASYCEIYASFEDWPMSFRVPREDLCSWQLALTRARSFLDQHVIERTERRVD
jgi:hypothetical protein